MTLTAMDYWIMAGVVFAAISAFVAVRQLIKPTRKKTSDKNFDTDIVASESVDLSVSEQTKANLSILKSKDVKVKIGGE